MAKPAPSEPGHFVSWPVQVPAGEAAIAGDLTLPDNASGIVIFAHGSGSSRLSTRNRTVANVLVKARFATLLLDLLTQAEEQIDDVTAELRFDIPFLARRVGASIDWEIGRAHV